MSTYTDFLLKTGLIRTSDAEIEYKLEAIVKLLCLLHGRDTYMKTYQKCLASRLLNKTLISIELEEIMLQKLKVACGLNGVNIVAKMFKDFKENK